MSQKELKPWSDTNARKAAIFDILKNVQTDDELRRHCLSSPDYVRQLFIDKYGMAVPPNVVLSFVPEADRANGQSKNEGSLVFEVPPQGTTDESKLIDFVRCTYIQWLKEEAKDQSP